MGEYMKKLTIIILAFCVLFLAGCGNSVSDVIDTPNLQPETLPVITLDIEYEVTTAGSLPVSVIRDNYIETIYASKVEVTAQAYADDVAVDGAEVSGDNVLAPGENIYTANYGETTRQIKFIMYSEGVIGDSDFFEHPAEYNFDDGEVDLYIEDGVPYAAYAKVEITDKWEQMHSINPTELDYEYGAMPTNDIFDYIYIIKTDTGYAKLVWTNQMSLWGTVWYFTYATEMRDI